MADIVPTLFAQRLLRQPDPASARAVLEISGGGTATYPVGSMFVTFDNTNPATLLGFGTWELIGLYGDGE